jgi:hypothetical protein
MKRCHRFNGGHWFGQPLHGLLVAIPKVIIVYYYIKRFKMAQYNGVMSVSGSEFKKNQWRFAR